MTPQEAAQWMLDKLNRVKWLDQETVAWKLSKKDKSLVYDNERGNPCGSTEGAKGLQ